MSLDQHINIFFKDIYIDKKINFFELWKSVFSKLYPTKNLDFNNIFTAIRINKSFYLCKYFISTNDLDGDVLECGVLRGFSAYLMRSLEDKMLLNKINNYYLLDSFEGLSEINKEDIPKDKNLKIHKKGELRESIETVENIFKEFNNVYLVKGWIPEVFESLDKKNNYKFVHLDVDLYKPTLESLEYIYDKVVKGGVIITDDFQSPLFPGNQKAWVEFFKSRGITNWLALPSGQAVIIKD